MKKVKTLLLVLLVIMLVAGAFTGCGNKPQGQEAEQSSTEAESTEEENVEEPADVVEDEAEEDEEIVIGFVAMNMFMTWMQYALEGAKEVAEAEGVTLIVYDAENKVDKQTTLVEDCIAQGVDAIVTDPINVESLTPALEEADAAGIPVLTFDRRAEGAPYFAFVGSDDVFGGKLAAQFIAEQLGGEGKVIELVGASGAAPAIDRGNGFHEEMGNYPGIEIVFSQSGEFIRENGMTVMEDAINAVDEFDAVFAHNDDMLMGALQAMKDANLDLDEIVTISYDGIPDALMAIESGEHDATIQYPVGLASLAMQKIIDYLKSGTVPEAKDDKIDPWVITVDNLDSGDFYPELQK